MKNLAPIAVFCYKRLDHLRQTINALLANDLSKDSIVYIFSDGARNEPDKSLVENVRKYLRTIKGFKDIKIIERSDNWGLNKNIEGGILEVLENHDRVIIVEDDIVTSPYFLRYMNDGLERYQDNAKVGAIQGYQYPFEAKGLPQTVFKLGCSCWGWATWKRAWKFYNGDGLELLDKLNKQSKGPLLTKLFIECLLAQSEGKAQAWDVCWAASLMSNDMVSLTPSKSMTKNIGFDSLGTQCSQTEAQFYKGKLCDYQITEFNEVVEDNKIVRQAILDFFENREKKLNKRSWWHNFRKKLFKKWREKRNAKINCKSYKINGNQGQK
jgi:hypothetical protein